MQSAINATAGSVCRDRSQRRIRDPIPQRELSHRDPPRVDVDEIASHLEILLTPALHSQQGDDRP